jgi:hypothetical protein
MKNLDHLVITVDPLSDQRGIRVSIMRYVRGVGSVMRQTGKHCFTVMSKDDDDLRITGEFGNNRRQRNRLLEALYAEAER